MPPIIRAGWRATVLIVINAAIIAYQLYRVTIDHNLVSITPDAPLPTTTTILSTAPSFKARARPEIMLPDDPSFVLADDDVEPARSSLPGYCNVCGPEDDICTKYGESFLARSRAYDGAGARVRRVIRMALAGQPVKIAVLGGSVTVGRGVEKQERWTEHLRLWWEAAFPNSTLTMRNAGVPGTGTTYFSMCFQEHMDTDADFVITEFAINDLGRDEEMASFEWMLRRALLLEKKPAVLNMQVFGLEYPRLTTGGDYHPAVASYYDTPVISLRNAVLPQILADPDSAPSYFSVTPKGGPDYKHINARMHRAFADILIHYLQSQTCSAMRRPPAASDAALEDIPPMRLQQRFQDRKPAPLINPTCASLREARTKLAANSTDGWEVKRTQSGIFYVADRPGARVSFITRAGALGQVRVTFMRSTMAGLGIARCWMDDAEAGAVRVDGFWWRHVSVIESAVVSSTASPGEHTVWCELTGESSAKNDKTEFWIVGVDGA